LGGDLVLEMFSKCGLAAIRATDRLGRYGGEEFLVVLVATLLSEAEEPLERIRTRVAACDWSRIDRGLKVTVTIGAAAYRRGETATDLMARADLALYRGKQGGRNCVILENRPCAIDLPTMQRPSEETALVKDAEGSSPQGNSEATKPGRSTSRPTEYWTDESAMIL
jgi:predicted signal transduction protein with EAL and GGDEF domain